MKDEIAYMFLQYGIMLLSEARDFPDEKDFADRILALPSLVKMREDAEKWRKVVAIYESDYCLGCPLWGEEYAECTAEYCVFSEVYIALTGEEG